MGFVKENVLGHLGIENSNLGRMVVVDWMRNGAHVLPPLVLPQLPLPHYCHAISCALPQETDFGPAHCSHQDCQHGIHQIRGCIFDHAVPSKHASAGHLHHLSETVHWHFPLTLCSGLHQGIQFHHACSSRLCGGLEELVI